MRLLIALLGWSAGSFAADGAAGTAPNVESAAVELDPLVVVAGKIEQPLSEVAAQITVIDADRIARGMVEDTDSLLRYEPGLELETDGTRFGATGVNVRGIGGNRVDIEIDGVPVRDGFAIGAYANAGRVLVETDRIKRMEVLHGPASAMHGSSALGGVLHIATWDPSDLLDRGEGAIHAGLRTGYRGADDSWVGSAIAAAGQGGHGLLAAATFREGHEMDNQAPASIPVDPRDWSSRDYLAKYTYETDAGNRLRLSASQAGREVSTRIRSLLGYGRRFRFTTSLAGRDEDDSRRFSVDYLFSTGGWEQGQIRVLDIRHDTDQFTREERAQAPRPVEIERRFRYGQDLTGAEFSLFRSLDWGGNRHRIGFGAEYLRGDIRERRDGVQTSLEDGSSTPVILGEVMPVRDFPLSRTDE
ncbi:MAG: TonB-dependent receptor plug domain-containing protein, partial [Gammaproteobacteria bacterium]|nr:TonB-dependent receptor plug domain-containing protein [Gammaproteobacteria bacterium]